MRAQNRSPDTGLDEARAFAAKAVWTFAETMPWAPHEYTTRHRCRAQGVEDEFEDFVRLIESEAGYWRPWGQHRWRSINVGDRFYWLHWNVCTVPEREVINRWHLGASAEPTQLSLEVE